MLNVVLEWCAFSGSLLSVWMYGRHPSKGPLIGIGVALTFILYGVVAGIYAASFSNIVFLYLHYRNWRNARKRDMKIVGKQIKTGWDYIQQTSHGIAVEAGWWTDIDTGEPIDRNVGELLCLIHSEISEGMEGHRKNKMDDKLPHRSMLEVELADAIIRIGDLAGKLGLDVGGAIAEKMAFNAIRPDHKIETRRLADGKKY